MKSKEMVSELISRYIKAKPRRISLKLNWNNKRSLINLKGYNLDETIEYSHAIDFTSFANGVLNAYKQVYGELEVVPISFREEIYKNDKVSLDFYPTGSAGIFDIFVEYKDSSKNGEWVVDELEKCIRRMFAPIVVFRGFEDLVTEEMKARTTIERLADPFSNTATDYEAMVYLHTASLAVPFSEDWRNIYMYLFSKYYPTHAERIGVYKDKLTEQEKRKLKDLKKWIYKQQMNKGK